MGMFDNLVLEDCYILEGEQADKYKADKKKAMNKAYNDNVRSGMSKARINLDKHGEKGMEKASETLSKKSPGFKKRLDSFGDEDNNNSVDSATDMARAIHAADRHDRRHPDRKVMEALDMLEAAYLNSERYSY